jgi:hypothetical protein
VALRQDEREVLSVAERAVEVSRNATRWRCRRTRLRGGTSGHFVYRPPWEGFLGRRDATLLRSARPLGMNRLVGPCTNPSLRTAEFWAFWNTIRFQGGSPNPTRRRL